MTDFKQASLESADFEGANLKGADLEDANLEVADLKEAKNLSIQQLSKVGTLYKVELDESLRTFLKEKNPTLLMNLINFILPY